MMRYVLLAVGCLVTLFIASQKLAANSVQTANPMRFASEAGAKAFCPSDTVVWLNFKTHIYHAKGSPLYGVTAAGAYGCETSADEAGFRAQRMPPV